MRALVTTRKGIDTHLWVWEVEGPPIFLKLIQEEQHRHLAATFGHELEAPNVFEAITSWDGKPIRICKIARQSPIV